MNHQQVVFGECWTELDELQPEKKVKCIPLNPELLKLGVATLLRVAKCPNRVAKFTKKKIVHKIQ
jgi:hypothetical protein